MTIFLTLAAGLPAGMRAQAPKQPRQPAARPAAKKTAARPISLQTRRNLGKAYYEQAQYKEAIGEFQKVNASGHALATDYLNLGLALLQANRLDDALGALTTAKQMNARLLAADYNLGILYKHELRYPDAAAALERVVAADPADPAAWFNLGTVRFSQRKLEEALEAYKRAIEIGFGRGQNFYVASLFRAFTALSQLKRPEEAQKFLQMHEKMRNKVPDIALQNPALESGKYGAIVVPAVPPAMPPKSASEQVTFAEITARLGLAALPASSTPLAATSVPVRQSEYSLEFARANLVPRFGPTLAVGDYDGDGRTDLYVVNPVGGNHLLHNLGDGTFRDVTEKAGVAAPGASLAATFADYDNSGKSSLFVAGLGGMRLYRNRGDGTFADESEKAGLPTFPGELATSAALLDADHDGFLDLVVTAYTNFKSPPQKVSFLFPDDFSGAAVRYYRNNGDGTFAEATHAAGLASAEGRARKVLFADFDNDGYMDLLIVRDDSPPLLYINQGEGKFADRTSKAGEDFARFTAMDAQATDFNHDGNFDVVLWTAAGYQVLLGRGDGSFSEAAANLLRFAPPSEAFVLRGLTADLNGDGFDDVLAVDAKGKWHFIANLGSHFEEAYISISQEGNSFASLAAAWLGAPGKLNLVGVTRGGKLVAFEKVGPPGRWVEVKLSGAKSNMQGVGAILEFKAGNFYNKVLATGGLVRVFSGDLARMDVVRVTWPNLIIQNMTAMDTNRRAEVRESERLASSCPLLYIWNGERYVYFTDVLGMAPLGVLAPDGSRLPPNPEELVRLPGNLREQDGKYVFQISDELREVEFFDQVRLLAVDHPAGEEVYANEIYSSSPVSPALFSVRQKFFPVSAVDDRGQDVLPLVREVDGRYPDSFRLQRVPGLAEPHTLTLDLGDVPASAPATLWLTGWVFWSDSNSARAVSSNSQLQLISPYIQVRDARGQWVTVVSDMGIPSATNRTMRVDFTGKFLSADHRVRIVTNLCVYWDQIFFSVGDTTAPAPVELAMISADLHYRGFSTPASDPAHRQPDTFDYYNLLVDAPWNPLLGHYTRYGAVEELLQKPDNRLVVLATGDQLTLSFDARQLPPLRLGYKRGLFLYLHGWAKDGDPNTATSKTVAPMPFREMSQYPYAPEEQIPNSSKYQDYLRTYQTRPGYALVPPLAPFTMHSWTTTDSFSAIRPN